MPVPSELDLLGLKCPMPVLRTRRTLARMAPGADLTVVTDDPLAVIDIPHFIRAEGHRLASQATSDGQTTFQIVKRL